MKGIGCVLLATYCVFAVCAAAANAMIIDTVPVGNVGNADDTHGDGYGAVDYAYNIGKYEVTVGQYTEFLNAVATVGDPHELYNPAMGSGYAGMSEIGGISRTGSGTKGDPWVYSVRTNRGNRPAHSVSFWDACRFANWLHNDQPAGFQDLTTTEDGAYSLNDVTNPDNGSIHREPGARVWIPSDDEWYKAAYHDGDNGIYYDYPTGTDSVPSNDLIDPDPGNNANFHVSPGDDYTIGSPYYMTEVGEFENSESPYGTFDQGGNVWEWTEAIIGVGRGTRGASFFQSEYSLHASNRDGDIPTVEDNFVGFRVATIPEPATLSLLALGGLALLRRNR